MLQDILRSIFINETYVYEFLCYATTIHFHHLQSNMICWMMHDLNRPHKFYCLFPITQFYQNNFGQLWSSGIKTLPSILCYITGLYLGDCVLYSFNQQNILYYHSISCANFFCPKNLAFVIVTTINGNFIFLFFELNDIDLSPCIRLEHLFSGTTRS